MIDTPDHSDAAAHREARSPLAELLALAAPTVATMASYTLMQFVDGLMVSRIGPDPVYVAAQGNGGVWAFFPIAVVMGLLGVINAYVSQNLGAGRPERAPAYAWNALYMAAAGAVLLIPYALVLPSIFALGFFGHEARVIELESAYARILISGAFLTMATRAIAQFFYGLHRPRVVLIAAVTGNLVNLAMNYALVYGHFGLPALGVRGSAFATIIGTAVELSIPLWVFLSAKYHGLYGTRGAWRPSLPHVKDILKIGWAPALMHGNEMICWAIFMSALVGHFSTEQNTAGWITLRYMQLSFMPAIGISFAVTATVGKFMGRGEPEVAMRRAYLGMGLTMAYMGLFALAMVVFRGPMLRLFLDSGTRPESAAEIVRVGGRIMIVAAAFQLFDAVGVTVIGALRGAGDTVWPGVATVILSWVCIVGLGSAFVHWAPGLGAIGPWIGAAVYIILLGGFLMGRFMSGKWQDKRLLDRSSVSAAAAVGAAVTPGPEAEPASEAASAGV